jgi:hypothetical protein
MVASGTRPARMMVVHDKSGGGFFLALVSADLSEKQIHAALRELGIEVEVFFELGDWKTAACGLTVAHVPFPAAN